MSMKSNHKSQVNKESSGLCSRNQSRVVSPECLPDGWKVEIKYLKSGPKEGGKYKCYVEPVTGFKFYSMKDVAHHLNTKMLSNCRSELTSSSKLQNDCPSELTASSKKLSNCPSELTSSSTDVNSKDNGKDSVDGLPPGWVKKVKVRKTGGRKDPYYSHPESEYIFRSKMDVLRYVESGTIGRLTLKRKKEDIDNVKVEDFTSPTDGAKRQKLSARARGRRLFTEGAQVSEPNVPKAETLPSHEVLDLGGQISESVLPKGDVPPSNDASELGGDCADLDGFISMGSKDSEEKQKKTDCAESKVESVRSLANGVDKCSERKTPRLKRKNNERALTAPRRSSERLAALRVGQSPSEGQSPKLGTSNQEGRRVVVQSVREADQTVVSAKGRNISQSKAVRKLASETEADVISEVSKVTTDEGNVPVLSSPIGVEEQSTICENGLEPTSEVGKLDGIQLSAGLEGERADGKPESPLISPFGDSWPDPCLEFAFKTLTGAIPVEESLLIEDYLKLHPNYDCNQKTEELTQPSYTADGTCQTDLFRFEPQANPPDVPEMKWNPPVLTQPGYGADGICRTDLFRFDPQANPPDVPVMKWNPAFSASGNEPKLNYGNNIFQWDEERKK